MTMMPFHQAEMNHLLDSNNAKQTQRKQYYYNENFCCQTFQKGKGVYVNSQYNAQ